MDIFVHTSPNMLQIRIKGFDIPQVDIWNEIDQGMIVD